MHLEASCSSIIDNNFSLIHIDDEHLELAVIKEINFAIDNLSTRGLIVIDDI